MIYFFQNGFSLRLQLQSSPHDGVHPFDEGRNTGEDGGLPGVVTSQTRHKAGNAVNGVLSTKFAVQRAT